MGHQKGEEGERMWSQHRRQCARNGATGNTQDGIKASEMWPLLFMKHSRSDEHRQRLRLVSARNSTKNQMILLRNMKLNPSFFFLSDPPRKPGINTSGLKEQIFSITTIVFCAKLSIR